MSSGLPVSFTLVMIFMFTIIGFFAGRAITVMIYRRKSTEKESLLKSPNPAPIAEQPAPLADPAKFTDLLRLWREKSSGALFVETSGHLLATSGPLNPNQKKRFIDLVKELAVWADVPATEVVPASAEPASKPASNPVATVPNLIPQVSDRPAPITAAAPIKTDPLPVATPPVVPQVPLASPTPPPLTPTTGVQQAVPPTPYMSTVQTPISKPASEPVKKQAVSMVEQIDEILQELIQRSDNPGRRIKLVEERNQGVIVWVGTEHFSGIDAVTDDSARDLIRAAAKEWERRSESRL